MPRIDLADLPLRRTLPFMRVPGPQERATSRVGVVGIPFDCGAHPIRVGARLGPAAIREQSQLLRPFNPPDFDFDPLAKLQVADWGDVDDVPGQIEDAFAKIERVIGAVVLYSGALPLTMGGEHAVLREQRIELARSCLRQRHGEIHALNLDSKVPVQRRRGQSHSVVSSGACTCTISGLIRAVSPSMRPACCLPAGPR